MKRSRLAATLALLLGAACATPAPRLPFQKGGGDWRATVLGGEWIVNKDFGEDTSVIGMEVVLDYPGTGGWSWEGGFRYASGDSDGTRTVYDPDTPTLPLGADDKTLIVDSEREIQFYELAVGVRQTYRPDERLQPYFGVGGSLLYWQSEESFVQPGIAGSQYPVDTAVRDHERAEYRPGIYTRVGLIWNLLKDQLREDSEFPVVIDVRGMLSVDYSYLEFSLSFGFGR